MLTADFCRRTGLTRDAVRLYVKLGLLLPAVDPGNRYQRFGEEDLERAAMIRTAQQLGFSLRQLGVLAREYDAGKMDLSRRLAVMRQQLAMVEEQAGRIETMRGYLRAKIDWMEAGEVGEGPVFDGMRTACSVAAPQARTATSQHAATARRARVA
jgi:MerR family transcriptional regulator, copper efflux regulator